MPPHAPWPRDGGGLRLIWLNPRELRLRAAEQEEASSPSPIPKQHTDGTPAPATPDSLRAPQLSPPFPCSDLPGTVCLPPAQARAPASATIWALLLAPLPLAVPLAARTPRPGAVPHQCLCLWFQFRKKNPPSLPGVLLRRDSSPPSFSRGPLFLPRPSAPPHSLSERTKARPFQKILSLGRSPITAKGQPSLLPRPLSPRIDLCGPNSSPFPGAACFPPALAEGSVWAGKRATGEEGKRKRGKKENLPPGKTQSATFSRVFRRLGYCAAEAFILPARPEHGCSMESDRPVGEADTR